MSCTLGSNYTGISKKLNIDIQSTIYTKLTQLPAHSSSLSSIDTPLLVYSSINTKLIAHWLSLTTIKYEDKYNKSNLGDCEECLGMHLKNMLS